MKLEALLVLLFNLVESRGPHHPHGEQPVDHKHHHYKPMKAKSVLTDPQLLHDVKHLEEDLQEQGDFTVEDLHKMSPDELEFQYFLAHDYDGNDKLDGLELLKAIYHTVDHEEDVGRVVNKEDEEDLEELANIVDKTIEADDTDGDGYISYTEYKAARFQNPTTRTNSVLAPASAPEVKMT